MSEPLLIVFLAVLALAAIVVCYQIWMNTPMHPESDDDTF